MPEPDRNSPKLISRLLYEAPDKSLPMRAICDATGRDVKRVSTVLARLMRRGCVQVIRAKRARNVYVWVGGELPAPVQRVAPAEPPRRVQTIPRSATPWDCLLHLR